MGDESPATLLSERAVTAKICLGRGERFDDKPCEHYSTASEECLLLRDRKVIEPVYEHGRCLNKSEIDKRVNLILKKRFWEQRHEYVEIEEIIYGSFDEINQERIKKGLLACEIIYPRLESLYSYVNKWLYGYLKTLLKERGLAGSPFLHVRAVDCYEEDADEGLRFMDAQVPAPDTRDKDLAKIAVDIIRDKLKQRALSTPVGTKEREVNFHQYDLVTFLLRHLRKDEDVTFSQAWSALIDQYEERHSKSRAAAQKRLIRYWKEIQEMFNPKG